MRGDYSMSTISPELVKEFVYNAHADFDKVNELLEQQPGLLAWDGVTVTW